MTELEMLQRAKMYMDKLAQGIDPLSDRALPDDTILNQVRLARCFFYVSGVLEKVIANDGRIGYRSEGTAFSITGVQLAKISPLPYPVRISEFIDLLYQAAGDPTSKRMRTTVITDWLLEQGLLQKFVNEEGKNQRVPTEAGNAIGIRAEYRNGQRGMYLSVSYTPEAQRFLLDHLPEMIAIQS